MGNLQHVSRPRYCRWRSSISYFKQKRWHDEWSTERKRGHRSFHWLAYQQLLDSALPIGGFSHSFGLETLVQEERFTTSAELEAYLHPCLPKAGQHLMRW